MGTRGSLGNGGIGIPSIRDSIIYSGYNEGVIIGADHFNGFLTYPNCPRYGGAGPIPRSRITRPYPGYNSGLMGHLSEGNGGFCKYSGCPTYSFTSPKVPANRIYGRYKDCVVGNIENGGCYVGSTYPDHTGAGGRDGW